MFIVGERINGMFKSVAEAIQKKDKSVIQDLALKQVNAGANALDLNVGPAVAEPLEAMVWLVETVQEVTKVPLSIDTTKPQVMEAGLKTCRNQTIINSISAVKEKMEVLLPLAKKHNSLIIGLTLDEKGIPQTIEGRTELACAILTRLIEEEMSPENLYLDPLILPVNVAQDQSQLVLETIKQIKLLSDPPPKTLLGLSNVSQKTLDRSLVNRTYAVMALAYGLDGAILDPLDEELIEAVITGELLLNKFIYCDSYIEAYHKK